MKIEASDYAFPTGMLVRPEFGIVIPNEPRSLGEYAKDAKRVLDRLSKDLKPSGIRQVIGLMLLLEEHGYNGSKNPSRKSFDEAVDAITNQLEQVTKAVASG